MHLLVSNILPVEWNVSTFERLVLPKRIKELVKALVTVRALSSRSALDLGAACQIQDIVAGKGKSLIMLLHGGPGTDKTLTAGVFTRNVDEQNLTLNRKVRFVEHNLYVTTQQ